MKSFFLVLLFTCFFQYLHCKEIKNYKFILLDIKNDKKYSDWGVHPVDIRSKYNKEKRAIDGARLAIKDSKKLERLTGTSFTLDYLSLENEKELKEFFKKKNSSSYNAILLDLNEEKIINIVSQFKTNNNQIYFNISETSNKLRNNICLENFLHIFPSNAMLTDAIAQYLVEKRWNKVLMLTGPLEEDLQYSSSFKISAKKFGLKIIDEKFFVNSNDPRVRDKNNLSFLTMKNKYNSIFISDIDGEFALKVPNATSRPALVSGSSGLIPKTWHWSYLRHGAPQLNGRFERMHDRRMHGKDWAAWMSIKIIVESVLRTKVLDNFKILDYMKSSDFKVDGSKGISLNFRNYTRQLRQTILLVSQNNWVTQVAPLNSFTHQSNDLDTLGILSNSCSEERK